MILKHWALNPFKENTYILYDETKECVIIDPGNSNKSEDNLLQSFIDENDLKPKCVLLTHSHIDHVMGLKYWVDKYKLDVYLHPLDNVIYENAEKTAQMYGLPYNPSFAEPKPLDGHTFSFGSTELEIRFVPGHAPGHVVFIHHSTGKVVAGDTLFSGSIGRTDLAFGNHDQLIEKIKSELFSLPEHYQVHCGHGPYTTIGVEKSSNPFF